MSISSRALRLFAAASTLALASQVVGCVADPDSQSDDITNVSNSKVKRQSIGNCWVYASVGWAESLRLGYSGEELNLSESYVSYWHWFEQIAGEGAAAEEQVAYLDKDQISTGGFFGVAAELMRRYGVMDEGKLIPEEAEAARSARQSSALAAINESLKTGVLSDRSKRSDLAVVRAEMDKAWQLGADVTALLDGVFGKDVSVTLDEATVPEGSGLHRPKDIEVGLADTTVITLADAIGKPQSSWDVKKRTGTYAWNEESYPSYESSRRSFLKKAQKALHGGLPVVMTWFVDFNAMQSNTFKEPPATPGRQGGHMTVLEDYQIEDVPGYGTLEAGTTVTDPKALEAALSDEATIVFFRIKNSWGSDLAPPGASDDLKGYNDLYMKYLNGPITKCTAVGSDACGTKSSETGLWGMVLPPAKYPAVAAQKAPQPDPDQPASCGDPCAESAAKQATCGECEAKVCEQDSFCCGDAEGTWDSQCVKEAIELCGLTCQ